MMKITLKRLMRFKNIDKNKIKSQFNNFRKFKRTIVLMGKSSKKAIIKTSMTIVMKRVKMMMKNFINIISLNKKSQTSVIWTRIIRKKLL
jgi:DNA-directed RNA polymerase sigma subunit (sigma70/sigma32)